MQQKLGRYLFALLLLIGISPFFSHGVCLADTATTITPNQSDSGVSVTVSDAQLNGKEISVVCYAPGNSGVYSDLTANKQYVVYMNQFTVNGTLSFSFKVKKPLVKGDYTLVISSSKGMTILPFAFIKEETPTATPVSTPKADQTDAPKTTSAPNPSANIVIAPKKTLLPAPGGVKAKSSSKKKIKVSWKKVKKAKGYRISICTKKAGKYKVVLTIKGGSKKSATLKKLKSGKVYYIKVCAYDLNVKKKVAGKYSKAIKVKVR